VLLALWLCRDHAGAQEFPAQPIRLVIPYAPRRRAATSSPGPGGAGDAGEAEAGGWSWTTAAGRAATSARANGREGLRPTATRCWSPNNSHHDQSVHLQGSGLRTWPRISRRSRSSRPSPAILSWWPESSPARSMADLIAIGKKSPGKLNFGSPGVGKRRGTSLPSSSNKQSRHRRHATSRTRARGPRPSPSSAASSTTLFLTPAGGSRPHVKSGKLSRAGGDVAGSGFSRVLRPFPTVAETRLPGLGDFESRNLVGACLAPRQDRPRARWTSCMRRSPTR